MAVPADVYTTPKDFSGVPLTSSEMDTYVSNNIYALQLGLNGDGSTQPEAIHAHLTGTLSDLDRYGGSIAAGKLGRRIFITDMMCEFIDDGTQWIGPFNPIPDGCDHWFEDFAMGVQSPHDDNTDHFDTESPAGGSRVDGYASSAGRVGGVSIGAAQAMSGLELRTGPTSPGSGDWAVWYNDLHHSSVKVPAIWRVGHQSMTGSNQTVWYGLGDGSTSAMVDGFYWVYDPGSVILSSGNGNWWAVTMNGGSLSNETDSGIAATTGGSYDLQLLEIAFIGAAEIQFLLNHTLVDTVTTGIETNPVNSQIWNITRTSSEKFVYADFVGYWAKRVGYPV